MNGSLSYFKRVEDVVFRNSPFPRTALGKIKRNRENTEENKKRNTQGNIKENIEKNSITQKIIQEQGRWKSILPEKTLNNEMLNNGKENKGILGKSALDNEILNILCEMTDADKSIVTAESSLFADLGLHSFEMFRIFYELEVRLGTDIPRDLYPGITTVGDLCKAAAGVERKDGAA